MKTFKLKDLINNRNKPKIVKKILDSIELSKLDKKDILNDLKTINTNKEELILNSDTIQQKCYFIKLDKYADLIMDGFPQSDLWDYELINYVQYLNVNSYEFSNGRSREEHILGFRYNVAADSPGGEIYYIPDNVLEYFIEVPFTRFYDRNANFFNFGRGDIVENGKELYKRLSTLNLTEGEWFVPNGYIFMIPDASIEDRGIILKVRKVGNTFEYESYRNGQPQIIVQLLPTGEVYYMDELVN